MLLPKSIVISQTVLKNVFVRCQDALINFDWLMLEIDSKCDKMLQIIQNTNEALERIHRKIMYLYLFSALEKLPVIKEFYAESSPKKHAIIKNVYIKQCVRTLKSFTEALSGNPMKNEQISDKEIQNIIGKCKTISEKLDKIRL